MYRSTDLQASEAYRSTGLRSDDDLEELTLAHVVKEAARDLKTSTEHSEGHDSPMVLKV